jgi:gluconate 2-dehydrogenase gamma chain
MLLSAGAVAAGAAAISLEPAAGRTVKGEIPWQPGRAAAPEVTTDSAAHSLSFFSPDEAAFVDAAVARLIPNDELGPGAKEANVTIFIDRQLAGAYGQASHWYMQGPWAKGKASQGYQTRMTPAQVYRAAIKDIDAATQGKFSGARFAALQPQQQDEILHALDDSKMDLPNVEAKAFFDMLLQNTIEGFFSDPIHGGNKDMVGWKLIGFPGARYDYRPHVKQHNKKLDLPPVSIKGRPGWNPNA